MDPILVDDGSDDDDSGLSWGEDPILHLARIGDMERIQLRLDGGSDPDTRDEFGFSLLHLVLPNNIVMAQLLIQKGVYVNSEDRWGRTPLNHICHESGSLHSDREYLLFNAIRFLLLNGASLHLKDTYGETPLTNAIRFHSLRIIRLLVENNADVTEKNLALNTPMHLACKRSDINICNLLIEAGAGTDLREHNDDGDTPVHLACQVNCPRLVFRIIRYSGADILELQGEYGFTPLHVACAYRCYDNVNTISLEATAELDEGETFPCVHTLLSNDRKTPLRVLFDEGMRFLSNENVVVMDIARRLIYLGADVNATDNVGKTSLHSVTVRGNAVLGKFLLENGASVNAADGNGETSLHIAFRSGNKEMIQLLMVAGADCWTENRLGEIAVDFATLDTLFFLTRNFHFSVLPQV